MFLVYVDAENVPIDLFKTGVRKIRETVGDKKIIGKFFGSAQAIGDSMQFGREIGFEFVETSTISKHRKNLADMKLIVDCLYDVLELFRDRVEGVYILSLDCDFLPLIYKLNGCGIKTVFLFDSEVKNQSAIGIDGFLKMHGWDPLINSRIFESVYEQVLPVVKNDVSKEEICNWISRKRLKFIKEISVYYDKDSLDAIRQLDVTCFGFWEVLKLLNKTDGLDLKKLATMYTTRVFGVTLGNDLLEFRLCQNGNVSL